MNNKKTLGVEPNNQSFEYNEGAFCTQKIEPLLKQIHALCKERNIPYVFGCCFSFNVESSGRLTATYSPGGARFDGLIRGAADMLDDDELAKMEGSMRLQCAQEASH